MNKALEFLRKPEGFKELLPGKASLKRHTEYDLCQLFASWGYREVLPPTVEYSTIFTAGMKSGFEDKLYRFSDERGRTLVLRPDLTLPLARIVATHMEQEPLPLRFFYQGSIFRYISSKTGKQREFFQTGVELIGADSPLADAEVISLAVASLEALGIGDFKICLGNINFLNRFLSRLGLGEEEITTIKEFLSKKDLVAMEEYVAGLKVKREVQEDILSIPRLKGGKEILDNHGGFFLQDPTCLKEMKDIFAMLECMGVTDRVMVDLGLVRGIDYYTGIVFQGYAAGLGSPICGGGRYDHLLGFFGRDLAAMGFGLNIDNILLLLSRKGMDKGESPRALVAYSGDEREQACRFASDLRETGVVAELALEPMSLKEAQGSAHLRGVTELVYLSEEGLTREFCPKK